jgi:hypothetical protein
VTITADATHFPATIIAAGPAAVAAWDDFTASGALRASTQSIYRRTALRFLHWLEPQGIGLSQITPLLLERFLDEKDLSYESKVTYRTALRRFLAALIARQAVPSNPADRAKLNVQGSETVAASPTRPDMNDAVVESAGDAALKQDTSPMLDSVKRRQSWLKSEIARERALQQLDTGHSERHGKIADNLAVRLDEVNRYLESLSGDDASPDSEPTSGGRERCSSGPAGREDT